MLSVENVGLIVNSFPLQFQSIRQTDRHWAVFADRSVVADVRSRRGGFRAVVGRMCATAALRVWKGGVTVRPIGINYSFDTTQLSAFIFILNLVENFSYV